MRPALLLVVALGAVALTALALLPPGPAPVPVRSAGTDTGRATAAAPATCGIDRLSGGVPAACWRPFSARSFLNRPLPRRARVQRGSQAMVRAMMSAGDGDVRNLFPQSAEGNDYYHPIVVSRPDAPEYTLECTRHCDAAGRKVRIPCGARQASGVDAHLAVIDTRAGVEYGLFGVATDLSDCRGGRLVAKVASFTRLDGDGRGACASAVCIGLSAGVIRFPELERGRIDHALFMVVGGCDDGPVFPASELSHCNSPQAGRPAMGQWFRLALTPRQIARLPVQSWQKTILRAFARYGGFVGDQGSNGGFELQTESQETFRAVGRENPWRAWAQRRQQAGDETVYVGDGEVALMFGAGLPRAFWEKHLRAVPPCAVRRACR